jgi:hypothetical protein
MHREERESNALRNSVVGLEGIESIRIDDVEHINDDMISGPVELFSLVVNGCAKGSATGITELGFE